MNKLSFNSLRKFNLTMGILHFMQGVLMLIVALSVDKVKNFKTPVMTNYLKFDEATSRLVTNTEKLTELPFGILVSIFLFLSAIAHFIIVSKRYNNYYNEQISKGINPFRWYEYALSSSIMIVLIAQLFGVFDIGALILIFFINVSMNLFGYLMEKLNQYTDKTSWSSFIFGSVAGIAPWIVITLYAFGNSDPSEVPWFVYAIFGSYFVFFNLFPINMILQYLKVGKWNNYIYGERVYIILSLVAKTTLAWLVFFGVMQPN